MKIQRALFTTLAVFAIGIVACACGSSDNGEPAATPAPTASATAPAGGGGTATPSATAVAGTKGGVALKKSDLTPTTNAPEKKGGG